ncbi:MAG: glycosyltransferase family 39 protein [Proteobacteria bacterium]|nr:glycosyltransferase family 39 protein [Pseudomonadota bacterium]
MTTADTSGLRPLDDWTDEGPAPARPLFSDDRALLRAVLITWAVLTLWKAWLAASTNVLWEEAHFFTAGMHPDLAYPDVPAGWPLFARAVELVFGSSVLALRLAGLAVAQLIPLGVWFLAGPLVGPRQALWAALLSMLLPPLGVSGTIFYPEGALQLLTAVMLGAAVRAVSTGRLGWWALTGIAGGLGLFTHYRFGVIGLGVALFALLTRDGRALWGRPGFWLAGVLAAAGLLPALLYNMREDWPSVAFHAVNRHIWVWYPQGLLLHVVEQLMLCTPVFFVGLCGAAVLAWRTWRAGDAWAGLVLWTAATVFLAFTVIAPFYRTRLPHWPFLAYPALVVFLPAALIGFVDRARSGRGRRARAALILAGGPLFALVGALGVSAYDLAWANPERVPETLRPQLQTSMEDWRRLEPDLQAAEAAARRRFGGEPALATAGHIPAARLEFPGGRSRVFALDDPLDEQTRFRTMRTAWGLDEAALSRTRAGGGVVLALPEPTYLYHAPEEVAFRRRLCRRFEGIQPERTVELPPGRTAVALFTARVRPELGPEPASCPLLPQVYLARPERAEAVETGSNFYGAAADRTGVRRVDILVDGKVVAQARLGLDPPGGRVDPVLAYDPAYPRVQYDFQLPAGLRPGAHRLSVRATTGDGRLIEGGERTIYVGG